MKICIFGGAFDPPHLGHQQIITDVLQQKLADQVWLVPTGKHDFDKQMSADEHRLQMLQLMIADIEHKFPNLQNKIKISEIELGSQQVNQTIDTLDQLAQVNFQDDFFWLMGSDNLARFSEWDGYQRIISDYQTHIYPRLGHQDYSLYPGLVVLDKVEPVAISSTLVRKKVAGAVSIAKVVSPSIQQYIYNHNLYQVTRAEE